MLVEEKAGERYAMYLHTSEAVLRAKEKAGGQDHNKKETFCCGFT